jgi:hypothetical protein
MVPARQSEQWNGDHEVPGAEVYGIMLAVVALEVIGPGIASGRRRRSLCVTGGRAEQAEKKQKRDGSANAQRGPCKYTLHPAGIRNCGPQFTRFNEHEIDPRRK